MSDLAALTATLAGRYEIDRQIGEGGMAVVYLARDVRHNRRVALKVLKPELGAVLGVERFLAEIQVTAALQHPNLLPLFDSGEAGGLLFYVMPFVEGESLRARLDRERQLPMEEAIRLGVALAGALDYAHKSGVIHRDLKPENILLQAGQPMIADFGIALAVSKAGGARVTQTGLSLGTPQYMSPEQATGERAIDSRTDLYSLGAIVYEMLTGEPPHVGGTAQAIIAKLMTEEARPVSVLRRTVPPHVDAAVRHALQKLPADRFASAADFAAALNGTRAVALPSGALGSADSPEHDGARRTFGNRRSSPSRLLVPALAVATLGSVGTATWLATRPAPVALPMQFTVPLPDSAILFVGGGRKLAISRDGSRMVAYVVANGTRSFFGRRTGEAEFTRIPGTPPEILTPPIGASPSFSPDGQWVLYGDGARLMRIPFAGGLPQLVADSAGAGSWGDGDLVAFQRGRALWITAIGAETPRLLATPDTTTGIFALKWPHVLPGGTHVLVTADRSRLANEVDSLQLAVVSVKDGSVTLLPQRGTNATYVPPGYLMFGQVGGTVSVAPFSLRSMSITGAIQQLLPSVWQGSGGATGYAVSNQGQVIFQPANRDSDALLLVDRGGIVQRTFPDRSVNPYGRIAPDGRRMLSTSLTRVGSEWWLTELATGAQERMLATNEGGGAAWTPDGRRIVFLKRTTDGVAVISRAWDHSSPDTVLFTDTTRSLSSVLPGPPTGWTILRTSEARTGKNEILIAPAESLSATRTLASTTTARIGAMTATADGRLVAYTSDESGLVQVYVQPVPGPGPRLLVSPRSGYDPVFSREGTTLYYRDGRRIQSVRIGGDPPTVLARDSLFFDTFNASPATGSRTWDVFPGDQRFLMVRAVPPYASVRVLINWPEALKTGGATATPAP